MFKISRQEHHGFGGNTRGRLPPFSSIKLTQLIRVRNPAQGFTDPGCRHWDSNPEPLSLGLKHPNP